MTNEKQFLKGFRTVIAFSFAALFLLTFGLFGFWLAFTFLNVLHWFGVASFWWRALMFVALAFSLQAIYFTIRFKKIGFHVRQYDVGQSD